MKETDAAEIDACRNIAASWAPTLRALANEERLLIVLWLAGSTCSVRELEQVTGLSQSLVSYHLAALRDVGLVVATSAGRSNRYRLASTNLDVLAGVIGQLQNSAARPDDPSERVA